MPKGVYARTPPIERFMAKVVKERNPWNPWTFCWVWTARKDKRGYAEFQVGGRKVRAHRWIYKQLVGPIPAGKGLDHYKCWNPSCVNPAHLRPATQLENNRNGKLNNAAKTRCKHGHKFTPENTRVYTSSDGYLKRECRQCNRIRQHR